MRKLLLILLLVPSLCFAQYPITEEFDSFGGAGEWTADNGGGVQNYGGAENYGTFNIGNTPYLNNTTHTMMSPTYDFSDCGGDITISFPIIGYIDANDIINFEYFDGVSWITAVTYTSLQNITYTNTTIPNTTTQFRFQLITDGANLVYFKSNLNLYSTTFGGQFTVPVDLSTQYIGGAPKQVLTHYYDIARFTIDCALPLPVELINFNVVNRDGVNHISWVTASEINNDYYIVENSVDGFVWNTVDIVSGAGNSSNSITYNIDHEMYDKAINYYRLTQVDFNGRRESFNIIVIDNTVELRSIRAKYDCMGNPIKHGHKGLVIILYSDGTTKKVIKLDDL